MRRGVLIYNPTAGQRDRRSQMRATIEELRRAGVDLANAPTEGPGHATRIVQESLRRGIDVAVVCGGDGTVSEAAAALAGTAVDLAILPGGTSNVLALELGIPIDLEAARRLVVEGRPRPVRPGLANGRPFLLMAGVGLDARVMKHMSLSLKRRFGRAGIFVTAVPEFFGYEFPRLAVSADGAEHAATFAVAARARHYAGSWVVAPEASLERGALEVVLFNSRRRRDLYRFFAAVRRGRGEHAAFPFVRIVRAREATIRSCESYAVEAQVDGDGVLETPLRCAVSESPVRVLAPPLL